jgi:hypothetical protein
VESGVWRFISIEKAGNRYLWDSRPGYYFVEWWEGRKRRRQMAGQTPSEASEAQRRKRHELVGESLLGGKMPQSTLPETPVTLLSDAIEMFLQHVRVHSPDKPRTVRRYGTVLEHASRILGARKPVDAIKRPEIDDYKNARSGEVSEQHRKRPIAPRTVNYEISVLRTFFYFLIRERNLPIENPCANFKQLKDPRVKAKRRPPTYKQAELDRIFAQCDAFENTVFATLLLTGMREEELCFLTWPDVELSDPNNASLPIRRQHEQDSSRTVRAGFQ